MAFIERNTERGFEQPVILGTGLTVFSVISNAYRSENITIFLEEFNLSLVQLNSAISYCKNTQCKVVGSVANKYCNGCLLRSFGDGWSSKQNDFFDYDSIAISKDRLSYSLCTIEEMDNDEFGVMGWVVAEKLEEKLSDSIT